MKERIKTTRYIGINGKRRIVAVGFYAKDVKRDLEIWAGSPWAQIKDRCQVVKAEISYSIKK